MRDKVFLDYNILVYSSLQNDSDKHDKTLHFLETIKGRVIFILSDSFLFFYSIHAELPLPFTLSLTPNALTLMPFLCAMRYAFLTSFA